MQKNRHQEESLVERFRRVLKESFDIDVDIDEEGEGIEVTTNVDATREGAHASLGRYSRRGSFDSFFDATADKVAGTEHGDLPSRTRRGSQGSAPNGHGKWRQRRARSDTEAQSYHQPQLPVRSRLNGASTRRLSGRYHAYQKRSASVSSHGSLQIRRNGIMTDTYTADNDAASSDYSERTTSLDLSSIQIPGINAPIPDERGGPLNRSDRFVPEPSTLR